jgi:parallel beta-helix repeat protein
MTTKIHVLALGAGLALAGLRPAEAGTVCVNPAGSGGCQKTISAAVTAATSGDTIVVAAGTYKESVIIPKSLSLVGTAGAATTIIDAVGHSNGIYVDGIDWPKLTAVSIEGFTVENASFEGILVTNASDVTILDNRVLNNDRALVITAGSGKCAKLPAFETNESSDCGEGIHLLGASYSIVSGNVVSGNSGGILLSDDTAANHDNQILSNTVSGNLTACGITLASHAPVTNSKTSFGVYLNTVAGNISTKNGTKPPFGAGAGIFTSIPGAAAYSNVIIDNTLTDNGMPGAAMHSHTPGQTLTNNAIIGNTISGNGADPGDTTTSTGIDVFAVSPATGTIISRNVISGESLDIAISTPKPAVVEVHLNQLLFFPTKGLPNYGVGNALAGSNPVDATLNWWGCAAGPGGAGCSVHNGPGAVQYTPWLTTP